MIESQAFVEPINPLPAMRADEWLRDMETEERTGTAPFVGGKWLNAMASYPVNQGETVETIRQKQQLAVAEIIRDISAVFFGLHGAMLGPGMGRNFRLVVLKDEWLKSTLMADCGIMYIDAEFAFERR